MSPRDSAPTRTAILEAAARLLESGGRDAITLRAVGDEAGVSRSAPYRHHSDKAALLRALAARSLREMAEAIRGAAAPGATPRERLRLGCRAYLRHALRQPHHYQLIFGETPLSSPGPDLESAADDAMAALSELVGAAQQAGHLGRAPTRELATVVWVLLHGLAALHITRHLHEPRTIDGDTRLDELLDVALDHLGSGAG